MELCICVDVVCVSGNMLLVMQVGMLQLGFVFVVVLVEKYGLLIGMWIGFGLIVVVIVLVLCWMLWCVCMVDNGCVDDECCMQFKCVIDVLNDIWLFKFDVKLLMVFGVVVLIGEFEVIENDVCMFVEMLLNGKNLVLLYCVDEFEQCYVSVKVCVEGCFDLVVQFVVLMNGSGFVYVQEVDCVMGVQGQFYQQQFYLL